MKSMKRLILVKQSSAIQIAHLYEHIFCMHVGDFFWERQLVPHVDYALNGKTYHGGIVVIDISLYTAQAIAVTDQITDVSIEVNEKIVKIALAQLIAEIEEPFESTGYQAVADYLLTLDALPWQLIDDITSIDVKQVRRTAGPLYIVEGASIAARKLTTTLTVTKEFATSRRDLLPLFRQLAGVIISSWQHRVADEYGLFSLDDRYRTHKNGVSVSNVFKVARTNDIDAPAVLKTCLGTVDDLRRSGAFERFMNELQDVSYYDRSDSAPMHEDNYESTLLLLGSKGWQEVATRENCDAVLKNITVEISFKKDKISKKLSIE